MLEEYDSFILLIILCFYMFLILVCAQTFPCNSDAFLSSLPSWVAWPLARFEGHSRLEIIAPKARLSVSCKVDRLGKKVDR